MNKLVFSVALMALALSNGLRAQDNILDARTNYGVGDVVTVTGVVTSDDNLGSVRYLQDATAGIALYPGGDWGDWDATPAIGDSLTVTGEITEYNGLLEVGPNLTAVVFEGAGTLPEPMVIGAADMDESLEGQLVRVNGATFPLAGLEITGNNTYDFTADGQTGIMYVRTSNSLVGETLTGCAVDLIGIVSQFSFDGTGGYQLLPRGPVDLLPASGICYTSPVVQSNMTTSGFTLSWSTDLASDGIVEYGLTEDLGMTASGASGTTDHSVDLTGLEAGKIYFARAISSLPDGESAASPIRPYATVSNSSGAIHVYFNGPVNTAVATVEEAQSLGVDMNDTVAAWITSAQHTLDVAAYNFNDQTLEDAFETAANNGVQIRWIYEGQNANVGLSNLPESVVTHPRTDGQGSGMHNKFIVGDAEYPESAFVLTGSTNLTTGTTLAGDPTAVARPVIDHVDAWLFEPDPAVIRAGLVDLLANQQGLARLAADEEYLTRGPVADTGLLTPFRVETTLPANLKAVRRALQSQPRAAYEIKCRRLKVDVEAVRRQLPLGSGPPATLIFCRIGGQSRAVLASRE